MDKEYNKAGRNKDRKIKSKITQEKIFNELLKESKKNSKIRKNQKNPGWEKFIENESSVSIRCQALRNKHPGEQCLLKAIKGSLLCRGHGITIKEKLKIIEIRQSLGIYSGCGISSLQTEIAEIQTLTDADLQDTTDELRLGIALLRKYLKETEDEKIAKNPGQLMWLIGEISRLKKEYHDIKHQKNVSFTREQVMFLFNQVYLILIELIKDTDLLKSIGSKIEDVGKRINEEGFKNIN